MVEFLVDSGADANLRMPELKPLELTAKNGNLSIVQILIDTNAEIKPKPGDAARAQGK